MSIAILGEREGGQDVRTANGIANLILRELSSVYFLNLNYSPGSPSHRKHRKELPWTSRTRQDASR